MKSKKGNLFGKRLLAAVSVILPCMFLCSCGIYDVDEALQAPYNLSMTREILKFYGDDEALLEGYNLWYKESSGVIYLRCEYDGMLTTPTIAKTGEATSLYTVDIGLLSPQDSNYSFKDLGGAYYFAVSAYGTGMAESGKAGFGLWPDGVE
ncbi:MAG: hypothetical protein JXQ30_02765 [Spirochaetes bacterium]|nr:hypothetical protein [Spirochaetota bacterium]